MLPYIAEVFHELSTRYAAAIWPLQTIAGTFAVLVLAIAIRPVRGGGRLVAALLAAGWAWCGLVFHHQYFATVNFAAAAYGWFFVVQAALLLWTGTIRGRLEFRVQAGKTGCIGALLAVTALLGFPAVEVVAGRWSGAAIPGLLPDPTAAFTLAFLAMVPARSPVHLTVLPVLWATVAAASAWVLAQPEGMFSAAVCLVGAAAVLGSRFQPTRD